MDFELPPELLALQAEALDVGRAAAEQAELTEDTWIAMPDRTFSMELGKRGWLGMTWPVEAGGGGRTAARAVRRVRGPHRRRGPARHLVVRRSPDGPHPPPVRHARAAASPPPRHPRRHLGVEHRDVRTRRRLRRGVDPHPGRPRRRRLRRHRPEDLELRRRHRRLDLPDRPHRSGRPAPRGPVGADRRHALPRHHDHAHPRHDRQRPLLRGLPRGRAGARRPTSSAS